MRSLLLIALLIVSYSSRAQTRLKDTLEADGIKEVTIQTSDNKSNHGNGHEKVTSLLEKIPGVSLISRGAFAQEPVLRGLNENQLSNTINGMRIFSACTDRMDPALSYIEPNNLSKIIVNTSNYNQTIGNSMGNINFQLNTAQLDSSRHWDGNFGTVWNSNNNEQRYLGTINYHSSKWAFHIDGIYRNAQDYTPGGNKDSNIIHYGTWSNKQVFTVNQQGKINFSQYSKWNIHANTKYAINNYSKLSIDYVQDEGHNVGYPALTMDVSHAIAHIASIDYNWKKADNFISEVHEKFYYNSVNHAMDDTKRPSEQVAMHMDMPGKNHTIGNLLQWNMQINQQQKISYQLESYFFRWNASMTMYPTATQTKMFMLTIPDAQKLDNNLTINYNNNFTNWEFNIGGNIESSINKLYSDIGKQQLSTITMSNSSHNYIPFNIFANARYIVNPHWNIYGVFNSQLRSPMTKELYSIYLYNPTDNYDYIGNPNVKQEKIQHIELSANYHTDKLHSSISVFGYQFSDYIAGTVQPNKDAMTANARGVKQYQNIGSAHSFGAEWSLNYSFGTHFSIINNSSYQYGKDNQGHALPLVQPFRDFTQISYSNSNLINIYLSQQLSVTQNHVSSFYGETRTPGFIIFNAGASREWRQFSLNIQCNNILNKYYYEHLDVLKLPRMGRNFECSISYKF